MNTTDWEDLLTLSSRECLQPLWRRTTTASIEIAKQRGAGCLDARVVNSIADSLILQPLSLISSSSSSVQIYHGSHIMSKNISSKGREGRENIRKTIEDDERGLDYMASLSLSCTMYQKTRGIVPVPLSSPFSWDYFELTFSKQGTRELRRKPAGDPPGHR